MPPPLSLWQELALAALGTLSLFYVLVFRVWTAEALGADLVFVVAVSAAAVTVVAPVLFDTGARHVVAWSPLPAALDEADARAADLAALPGRLIDGALARLGFESDDDEGTEEIASSEGATANPSASPPAEPGPLSAHIRPSVEGLVALLLRVAAGAISALVLALAILLRAVRALARRLRRTGERLDRLEAALAAAGPLPDDATTPPVEIAAP